MYIYLCAYPKASYKDNFRKKREKTYTNIKNTKRGDFYNFVSKNNHINNILL
jgi:hypothetical protein